MSKESKSSPHHSLVRHDLLNVSVEESDDDCLAVNTDVFSCAVCERDHARAITVHFLYLKTDQCLQFLKTVYSTCVLMNRNHHLIPADDKTTVSNKRPNIDELVIINLVTYSVGGYHNNGITCKTPINFWYKCS